jgi:hypothetical protein
MGAKQRANCHVACLERLAEAASSVTQRKDDSQDQRDFLLSTVATTLKGALNVTTQAYPNLEHIIVGNSPRALKAETSANMYQFPSRRSIRGDEYCRLYGAGRVDHLSQSGDSCLMRTFWVRRWRGTRCALISVESLS